MDGKERRGQVHRSQNSSDVLVWQWHMAGLASCAGKLEFRWFHCRDKELGEESMDQNKVSYNFGRKGWTVIGFEIVLLFFMTGLTVDGLNIIVPAMAEYRGGVGCKRTAVDFYAGDRKSVV